MYNEAAVVVALTHVFFGYMVISLLTILRRIDDTLYDAAANLGASRFRMFVEITLPLSLPGILAGCMLVFTLGGERLCDARAGRRLARQRAGASRSTTSRSSRSPGATPRRSRPCCSS